MVKKNKFSKSCNAIEVKYIGTFFVFLWAFSTRHYICIGSGCVIGSGVLLPPPSLPFKPYIISVDMPWWSQPQLELDDLELTIWGNTVLLGHRSQRLQWPIVITRCPSSVVCPSVRPSVRLFTFSTSSPEPLDGFWWNLVWMKYSRSLTSVVVFWPDPPRGGSRAGQK